MLVFRWVAVITLTDFCCHINACSWDRTRDWSIARQIHQTRSRVTKSVYQLDPSTTLAVAVNIKNEITITCGVMTTRSTRTWNSANFRKLCVPDVSRVKDTAQHDIRRKGQAFQSSENAVWVDGHSVKCVTRQDHINLAVPVCNVIAVINSARKPVAEWTFFCNWESEALFDSCTCL